MKLVTILAAFAGLHLVTAGPPPEGLAAHPTSAVPKSRAAWMWSQPNPYPYHQPKRQLAEVQCGQALDKHGCMTGLIHIGQRAELDPLGQKTGRTYHNVEELFPEGGPPKKLRVFSDGTSTQGWLDRDERLVTKSNQKAEWQARKLDQLQSGSPVAPPPAPRRVARPTAQQKAKPDPFSPGVSTPGPFPQPFGQAFPQPFALDQHFGQPQGVQHFHQALDQPFGQPFSPGVANYGHFTQPFPQHFHQPFGQPTGQHYDQHFARVFDQHIGQPTPQHFGQPFGQHPEQHYGQGFDKHFAHPFPLAQSPRSEESWRSMVDQAAKRPRVDMNPPSPAESTGSNYAV